MLRLAFINVGQGDTAVAWDPDSHEGIVVDCCDAKAVLDLLRFAGVQRLRAIFMTHLHSDHYSGVVDLLETCDRRGIAWDCVCFNWWSLGSRSSLRQYLADSDGHSEAQPSASRSLVYQQLCQCVRDERNRDRCCTPDRLTVRPSWVRIEVLHPKFADIGCLQETGQLNNTSTVVRLRANGGASVLFTGDIEADGWDIMCQNGEDSRSDVLSFPHHGAWNGDPMSVLAKVAPHIVVISVGGTNSYGHPTANVLAALRALPALHTVCTQVTPRCARDSSALQPHVERLLAASGPLVPRLGACSACPCGSHVFVDLDAVATLVHPSLETHAEIMQSFAHPQCIDCASGMTDTASEN